MKARWLFAMAMALSAPAAAEDMTYGDCVAMVSRSPQTAEQRAQAWQTHGGGAAAMHCNALALTALKRYAEAARVLDALSRNREFSAADRGDLADQAGNAWLLAGKPGEAIQSFTAALGAQPNDIGTLADRARARALQKDWKGADADLSAAIFQDQNRADLLVMRASARWAMNRKDGAATDIVRALELYPDYPPALVERGKMKYSANDVAGARHDWKVAASGQGEAAQEAKDYLKQLGPESKRTK
jgi:tetratricopeptide (TPR) repeat protein